MAVSTTACRGSVGGYIAGEQIGTADEIGHEPVIRVEVDLLRIAGLDYAPGLHDRNEVRQRQGFERSWVT